MSDRGTTQHGSGSLFFDKTKKRWVVMASLPNTADGKRRRLRRTFQTKSEAAAFLAEGCRISEQEKLVLDPTVTDLLTGWQGWINRRVEAGQLSVSSANLYGLCARHVGAEFGSQRANEVSVDDVERFLAKAGARFSGRYVAMQRNAFDQAYRWGQRNRLLVWNPVQLSLSPSQQAHRQGTVLTAEQAQRFLKASAGDRLHALWAVMLGLGLRPGEAMALTWPCIDFEADPCVVHVRSYLRQGSDGPFLGKPKTQRSTRSLDTPMFVVEALEDLFESRQSPVGGAWSDLVFHTSKGTPHGHRNLRRALKHLCANADLPALTLYDLRRTAGSLLVDSGAHLESVADLLGHSSVATTRRHYVRAVRPTVPYAVGLNKVLFNF
jgi:integrase